MKMLLVALLARTVMPLASTSWLTDCTTGYATGGGNGEFISGSRPSGGLSGAPGPHGTRGGERDPFFAKRTARLRLGRGRVCRQLFARELRLLQLGLGQLRARLDLRVPLRRFHAGLGLFLLRQLIQ